MLKDIAHENEMKVTIELNRRIERLNDIVKRLTALTVILMIPTLIASHFGMNFVYMPELRMPLAYPVVIISQIAVIASVVFILKSIRWL
jgi:magnesium transporter